MKTYETDHYIFSYEQGSLAEKEIIQIATTQEEGFAKICNLLKINYTEKIQYFLLDSAKEVGKLLGGDGECNGFAICGERKIYAVYNDDVKCIGPHEDAHLISFEHNYPHSRFIVEGLAMFFDETWWRLPNEIWSAYYKTINGDISVAKFIDNDDFYSLDCMITYPIAGAFTSYLISAFGVDKYIQMYKYDGADYCYAFAEIFGCSLSQIEEEFWQAIAKVKFDINEIEKALNS